MGGLVCEIWEMMNPMKRLTEWGLSFVSGVPRYQSVASLLFRAGFLASRDRHGSREPCREVVKFIMRQGLYIRLASLYGSSRKIPCHGRPRASDSM